MGVDDTSTGGDGRDDPPQAEAARRRRRVLDIGAPERSRWGSVPTPWNARPPGYRSGVDPGCPGLSLWTFSQSYTL
jgi:hypothetical protein